MRTLLFSLLLAPVFAVAAPVDVEIYLQWTSKPGVVGLFANWSLDDGDPATFGVVYGYQYLSVYSVDDTPDSYIYSEPVKADEWATGPTSAPLWAFFPDDGHIIEYPGGGWSITHDQVDGAVASPLRQGTYNIYYRFVALQLTGVSDECKANMDQPACWYRDDPYEHPSMLVYEGRETIWVDDDGVYGDIRPYRVPTPSTLALLGLGLAGLVTLRRKA